MDKIYIEDKTFDSKVFSGTGLAVGEYELCKFINCDFSNSKLADIDFTECIFTGCNLSMANLTRTGFRDVQFKDCKMMGLHFENCSEFLFEVGFENCVLSLSSFYKRKLKKTQFRASVLHEVDFADADLSNAVFDKCDLSGAIFDNTLLEKADFRTAYNYEFDPAANKIKKAKFSVPAVVRLLDKYDIDIGLY